MPDFTKPLFKIALIGICAITLSYIKYIGKYKDDCLVEEVLEDVIEDQTGMDIDFSPDSKEQ